MSSSVSSRAHSKAAVRAADPAITLSEGHGVRYLHFGTEWIQGAMRIARPFAIELEYQQQMMAAAWLVPQPQRIVLLGLGAGALAKFCWKFCAPAAIDVVELSPAVVSTARHWFSLPDDPRLSVTLDDAQAHLSRARARASADWLLVDLYDSAARGPVYDGAEFYRACQLALRSPGVAVFNLFGRGFRPSLAAISQVFGPQTVVLPPAAAGNRVVLAYRGGDFATACADTRKRAAALQKRWRLPMIQWQEQALG